MRQLTNEVHGRKIGIVEQKHFQGEDVAPNSPLQAEGQHDPLEHAPKKTSLPASLREGEEVFGENSSTKREEPHDPHGKGYF